MPRGPVRAGVLFAGAAAASGGKGSRGEGVAAATPEAGLAVTGAVAADPLLRDLLSGLAQLPVHVGVQVGERDPAVPVLVGRGAEQAIDQVLGEIAGAVLHGRVIG